MTYPFPTAADDERYLELGIEPAHYPSDALDSAAQAWAVFSAGPATSDFFVQLLAIREGSVAEATVLWDAAIHHRNSGLRQYTDRSARYYVQRYGRQMLSERSCSRAITDLLENGLLVSWPQKKNVASRIRLDWVALHLELRDLASTPCVLPGLDGQAEQRN